MFAPHHYLSSKLNAAADCWLLKWGNDPIGFCAVLPQPSGSFTEGKRITRLVMLPDFQGLGVGTKFMEAISKMYIDKGYKLYIRSAHAKLAHYWEKTPTWRRTNRCGKTGSYSNGIINNAKQNPYVVGRKCYSYEYVGMDFVTKPHVEFAIDGTSDIDLDALKEYLKCLSKDKYVTVVHGGADISKHKYPVRDICRSLGIRTELLYINGAITKKRRGDTLLVSLKKGSSPVFKKVS